MGRAEYTQLKLLAIVLPEPAYSFVIEQQNYIASTWGPRHALRTPPHLTLIEPLALSANEITIIESLCSKAAASHTAFHIRVCGYGAFVPRVVFINPIIPTDLIQLQSEMRTKIQEIIPDVLKKYEERTFHPHITVAHRDMNTDQFEMMWGYFENLKLDLEFTIDRFHILGHRSTGWEVDHEFIFNHI